MSTNELGWRSSLAKLAALVAAEADASGPVG